MIKVNFSEKALLQCMLLVIFIWDDITADMSLFIGPTYSLAMQAT